MKSLPHMIVRTTDAEGNRCTIGMSRVRYVVFADKACFLVVGAESNFYRVGSSGIKRVRAYTDGHFFTPRGQRGKSIYALNLEKVISMAPVADFLQVYFYGHNLNLYTTAAIRPPARAGFLEIAKGRFISLAKVHFFDRGYLNLKGLSISMQYVDRPALLRAAKAQGWMKIKGGFLNPHRVFCRQGNSLLFSLQGGAKVKVDTLPAKTRKALGMDDWPLMTGILAGLLRTPGKAYRAEILDLA